MPDTIGRITVPTPAESSQYFPLVSQYGYSVENNPITVPHQFGSYSGLSEQRYLTGFGPRRFYFKRDGLSRTDRAALKSFFFARQGRYESFLYRVPQPDRSTVDVRVIFDKEPLTLRDLATLTETGFYLVECPSASSSLTFSIASTCTRFPSNTLATALSSQVQQIIPLVKIRVANPSVPTIYLSDRRVTVGGQLYLPRVIGLGEPRSGTILTQTITGASDSIQFTLGNADRVMTQVANDCDLMWATITLDLYHVNSGILLQLWKGYVNNWVSDGSAQFRIQAADGLWQINQQYPNRSLTRTCWITFNDGKFCPYSTIPSGETQTIGSGGNPNKCSYYITSPYDSGDATNKPGGCIEHGMCPSSLTGQAYFGGHPASPQNVSIMDNSTGIWGNFLRNRVTSTSIISDTVFGTALPEIWCNDDGDASKSYSAQAKLISYRDESDFADALGVVGAGPIGGFTPTQTVTNQDGYRYLVGPMLDGFLAHGFKTSSQLQFTGYHPELGLRQVYGNHPANSSTDSFSLGQGTPQVWDQTRYAAGTAFVELRVKKPSAVQPSTPDQHQMTVPISQGLTGYVWSYGRTRSTVRGLTDPFWVAINAYLRAIGKASGIPTPPILTGSTITISLPASSFFGSSYINIGSFWTGFLNTANILALGMISSIAGAFIGNSYSIPMSDAANQAETILKGNLSSWKTLDPHYQTTSNRALHLTNFDTIWSAYTTACNTIIAGDPNGDDAKKALNRSISDRNHGGKYDWFVLYRDPIANSPTPGDNLTFSFDDPNSQVDSFVLDAITNNTGTGCSDISDQTVNLVFGSGTEKQYRFQGTLAQSKPFRDWLQEILDVGLGFFTWDYGRLRLGGRFNASATATFNQANTLFNSLSMGPITAGFDGVRIDFADRDYQYQANHGEFCDKDHAALMGRQNSPIIVPRHSLGCASLSQAVRTALVLTREEIGGVNEEEWTKARTFSWKSSLISLDTYPGQVVSMDFPEVPPDPTTNDGIHRCRILSMTLNSDWSITFTGQTVRPSMYDLTVGPRPNEAPRQPLPVYYYPVPLGLAWGPLKVEANAQDSLFPGEWTFSLGQSYTTLKDGGAAAVIDISGCLPVTQFIQGCGAPVIGTGSVTVSTTGGNLWGGKTYRVAVACASLNNSTGHALISPQSSIVLVEAPAGTNTCSIQITGIVWPSFPGLTHVIVYVSDVDQLISSQQLDALSPSGSSYTPTTLTVSGPLNRILNTMPNPDITGVRIKIKKLIHGGVLGAGVTSVSGNQIVSANCIDTSLTPNDWTGRSIAVFGRPLSQSPYAHFRILSFDPATGTFTLDRTAAGIVQAGDAFVVTTLGIYNADTPTVVSDPGLSNSLNTNDAGSPTPYSGIEPHSAEYNGAILRVISGLSRGEWRKIIDNDHTTFTVARDLLIDSSSVWVVEEAAWKSQTFVSAASNSDPFASTVIEADTLNWVEQSVLVMGVTVDSSAVETPEEYGQFRMCFVYGASGSGRSITEATITASNSPYTLDGSFQFIHCDTSAGSIIVNVASANSLPLGDYTIDKITDDTNTVDIVAADGEDLAEGHSVQLTVRNGQPGGRGVYRLAPQHD